MQLRQRSKLFWLTGCIGLFLLNGISTQQAFAFQNAVWVSPLGNDSSDGSQATPFQTINHALSTISVNDTILLLPGTYQENVVASAKGDFVLKSASAVDTAHIQATQSGPALYISGVGVATSRNTVIENILISHTTGIDGSAIQLEMATATIRNNRLFNNQSTSGAAVLISSDGTKQPLLKNNIIESNIATFGAGVFVSNTPLEMKGNIFRNNVASQRGGAVNFSNCYGTISAYNTFFANQADSGAAIFINSGSSSLSTVNNFLDNRVINNTATSHGGGFFYQGSAVQWLFTGNTFAENHAQINGGAGYFNATFNVILRSNVAVLNTADNNGGAFVFNNMASANVYLWSNNITGNKAGNNGGGIYLNNVNQLTVGGSNEVTNNLFHNRDISKLNNITSTIAISNLNLSQNYWGHSDSLSVLQQLSIPNVDQNLTWDNFTSSPIDVSLKLFQPTKEVWFDDGKILINGGFLLPAGDSTLVIRTNPDTSFTINDSEALLPKVYSFDWRNVNLSSTAARLTFFLDETELNALGNPFYQNLRVLQYDNSSWTATSTDAAVNGLTVSTQISDFAISDFAVGLDINASDTILIVDPRPNRADVNKNDPISIQFQKAMQAASLSRQNIRIRGSASGNRDFNINFDSDKNRLFLLLNDALQAGENVSVILSDSLKTASGEKFNGYSWQYITSAFRGSATFQPVNSLQTATGNNEYLFNDFDNDLVPELIELSDNLLTVYKVSSDGALSGQSQNLPASFRFARLADLDNDFSNDIVLFNDSDVLAYSYNALDGFNQIFSRSFGAGNILNDVIIYDFNNDVIPDMAFLTDLSDFRQLDCYYGTFSGSYRLGQAASILLSGPANTMSIFDWNADGLFDIIVSNGSSTTNLALLTNQKTSFFSTINPLSEIITQSGLLTANVWEDLQYQNQSEIVVAGQSRTSDLLKFFNVDEDGSLIQTDVWSIPSAVQSIASGDLNSDGFNDLAVSYNNHIKIILSNASGFLKDTIGINTTIKISDIQIIDFDADGDLDLFTSEQQDGQTLWQIFANETRRPRSWWVNSSATGGDGSITRPFTKINDAIVKTFENDSVFIFPGIYNENLSLKHSLFIASADTIPVVLKPATDNFFQNPNIVISDVGYSVLANINIQRDDFIANSVAVDVANSDSLVLQNMRIEQFESAIKISDSKGHIANVHANSNSNGIQIRNSELSLQYTFVERNTSSGLMADNSILDISESSFRENGVENSATNSGINIINGSNVSLVRSESSLNGNANIQLDNATFNSQFVYIGRAISRGSSSEGNGIFARNNSTVNIYNTVFDNNDKTGITLDNSDAVIQNSILVNNDSLNTQNGGGIFARAGSNVNLRNSILFGNNSAFSTNSSSVTAEYNNFFGNMSEPAAALLGTGNLSVNPLLVFMYNPLGLMPEFDSFANTKLAPGSPLIDAGDPAIRNGAGPSRSDIGIFGNIGLPQTFESIPEPTAFAEDSSLILSWDAVSAEESSLWTATAIFRNQTSGFTPDTSDLVGLVAAGSTTFTDNNLTFGSPYYYRLAYVDTNGGANAYSAEITGQIDFSEISLQNTVLNVQLGQGDTLLSSVSVFNSGTLPVSVAPGTDHPDWLRIMPQQRIIGRNQSENFFLVFDATGLQRDSLYRTSVDFIVQQDSSVYVTLDVRMLVSYRDFRAPQVTFDVEYPDTVRQAGISFLFSASDSINSSIGTPTNMLVYTYRFAAIVNNQPVLLSSDTTPKKRVDFYPLDNGRYLFEVAAIDTAGNGGLGINSQTVSVVVKIDDLSILSRLWHMITIPRNILNSTVPVNRQAIESVRHWNGQFYEYVAIDSVEPGKGYWVITKDRKKIDLTRFPNVNTSEEFGINIRQGWNMIGNPWSWSINLDSLKYVDANGSSYILQEAVSQGLVNSAFYLWRTKLDTQEYQEPLLNRLKINTGYWMYANQPGRILFNPKPFVLNITGQPVFLPKGDVANDAIVRLKIRQDTRQDNANFFGVSQDKGVYPVFYQDALEAPSFNNNLRLYYQKGEQKLASNLLSFAELDSVFVWDLNVEGNDTENEIVLTWDFSNQYSSVFFFLYNLETGQWINLKDHNSFIFTSKKKSIPLKLYATLYKDFSPQVLPTKFSLSQNYPNPFNPSTSIKVNIPYFADGIKATVDIFDVLGRKVKNILNRNVKSGEIVLSWQGINESGNKVSSGIYFYRLQAGDFISSKKMILIR